MARYRYALRRRRSAEEELREALAGGTGLDAALSAFRARSGEHFFEGVARAGNTLTLLESEVDGWRERVLRDADRIRAGTVRPLGRDSANLDELSVPSAPPPPGRWPWHDDALNDHRWGDGHFYKQVPMELDRADLKIPWELSRFQHLPTLGMAYRLTGDDSYAAAAVTAIDDWIERNPVGYGVNWITSMEVAIRAVNWLWAWELMAPSPAAGDPFLVRFLASLLEHGRHIADNIEVYADGLTTNHTLADYAGLVHLGLCLPELREASAWVEEGAEGLEDCMRRHVHPDGGHFENSIAYHRLVLEMLLTSHVLAERHGRGFSREYRESLERMVEFVHYYTRPDGLAPLVGDSDDGRFHVLARYFDWDPQDHRYLLALGGAMFGRDDLAAAGRAAPGAIEEVAWVLGPDATSPSGRPAPDADSLPSRAFAATGRYVMRSGDTYVLVCADEVGTDGLGNHKHNDILSFELTVRGEPVVVDRGTFVYQSSLEWRDRFRSTRSHSTVMVDGTEQNEMLGAFWMRSDAGVEVEDWRAEPGRDVLVAAHTGYERLPDPVRHRRLVALVHDPLALVVVDTLTGDGEHAVESLVQLDPRGAAETAPATRDEAARAAEALSRAGAEVDDLRREDAVRYRGEHVAVAIVPIGPGRLEVTGGWHASRYGRRVPAPVAALRARVAAGEPFGYVIVDAGG